MVKMGLDEQDAREYQLDVYHTVLLKDVIMRNQIRNVPFLENLVRFLADNTGKIISTNSIAKYMKSHGDRITSTVIINYTKFLCEAYLIYKVVGRNDLLTPPFTLCRNQNVSSLVSGWLNGSVSLVSTVTSIDGFSCSTLRLPKFRKSILLADTFSCDWAFPSLSFHERDETLPVMKMTLPLVRYWVRLTWLDLLDVTRTHVAFSSPLILSMTTTSMDMN